MFRVVLYGPPLAGKTTILAAFAKRGAIAAKTFEATEEGSPFGAAYASSSQATN